MNLPCATPTSLKRPLTGFESDVRVDKYAESYRGEVNRALAFAGKQVDFYAERKAAMLCELAQGSLGDPADLNILDVGCGIGLADGHLVGTFGSVFNTSREEIEQARRNTPLLHTKCPNPPGSPTQPIISTWSSRRAFCTMSPLRTSRPSLRRWRE